MHPLPVALSLLLLTPAAAFAEGNLSLEITPSGVGHEQQRLFNDTTSPPWQNRIDEKLTLQWQHEGISLQAGLESQQIHRGDNSGQGRVYELFYDFSLAPFDLSVGKKQMSMGVGYGYRPLDMVQQELRQRLSPVVDEGVPLVSIERFTETGSVGLLYVNHLEWDGGLPSSGREEWAIKGYNLIGDYDLQWLLHHDEQRNTSAAIGFSWVGGEATEFHGSVRLQGQYPGEPTYHYNTTTQTVSESPTTEQNGTVTLLGMNWSHRSGITLLTEYWVDQMATSDGEWKSITDDRIYLANGGAITPSNAVQMATLSHRIDHAFSQTNLKRKNLFLRVSYDGEWADPSMDLLYHPEDGGHSLTVRAAHEISQSQRVSFAYRHLNGKSESVMGNIGDNHQVMLMWEIFSAIN